MGAASLTALSACSTPRTIRLECDLDAPVLLGKPVAVGGANLAYTSIDEEYSREVFFRAPPPGVPVDGDEPPYQGSAEDGVANVFERNAVSGALYLGRYEGLIIFVPVWNNYLGIEGEVVHVSGPAPAEGAR